MPERILLIGDVDQALQATVTQARPGAQVVAVPSVFDGIAELSAGRSAFGTVLAAAEPIERRPESAVRILRDLAGEGRLLLFGHPTLEPLSRKMLQFGVDDYVVTPTTAGELRQALGGPTRPAEAEPTVAPPSSSDGLAQLANVPLADLVLDALFHSPHDAPAAVVARINAQLAATVRLAYTAVGGVPPTTDGSATLTHPVRAGGGGDKMPGATADDGDVGHLHLSVPRGEDDAAARHALAQFAHLIGRVAALQDRHNRLQKLAITDELTGLYNGRYFHHYLNRIVERARTMRFPVTLLLFDIDNFKKYNDQYGHGVGDEILRGTAALMRKCVRDHDLVARISGDEFAVVFWEKEGPRQPRDPAAPTAGAHGRPPQTPVQILERFRRNLSTQMFKGLGPAGQGTLTISGGLAVYPYDANTVPDLIEAADQALMFKAKKSGKNSIYLVGGQPTAGSAGGEG